MIETATFVGLLNLGVGIYTAVQTQRIRRDTTEIKSHLKKIEGDLNEGFNRLECVLNAQSERISQIIAGQRKLLKEIRRTKRELNARFDKQEAQHFLTKCRELSIEWRRFAEVLSRGGDLTDQGSVVRNKATNLQAWAEIALSALPRGNGARQPYLVAIAMAKRARADSWAEHRGDAWEIDKDDLRDFIVSLQKEAFEYCDHATLFDIACGSQRTLLNYLFLHRGLLRGAEFFEKPEATTGGTFEVSDSDFSLPPSFEKLRKIFTVETDPKSKPKILRNNSRLQLKTIEDYRWYLAFSEQDSSNFNVHSKSAISISEIYKVFGTPKKTPIEAIKINELKVAALPSDRTQFVSELKGEFAWDQTPQFGQKLPQPKLPGMKKRLANKKTKKLKKRRR